MTATRYLIVNADDFGRSAGVNRGIIQAHERGIVTSAGLMVRWPAAREAAEYGRGRPVLSLGLHFDLGEWAYRGGRWVALYEVVPVTDRSGVEEEARAQLATFRRLTGRGPTHLDSHQHIHRHEPVLSVLAELARRLGIPLRGCSPQVRYCGDFYGQTGRGEPHPGAVTPMALVRILEGLPAGVTELGCHPGMDDGLGSMYRRERDEEVKVLCDPSVREAIAAGGIVLCSFGSADLRP
jgi:predicted glycoside hydrolase/deacetylase ChbG (UPF0249 family)